MIFTLGSGHFYLCLVSPFCFLVCFLDFFFVTFRSFRSVWAIAGTGWVNWTRPKAKWLSRKRFRNIESLPHVVFFSQCTRTLIDESVSYRQKRQRPAEGLPRMSVYSSTLTQACHCLPICVTPYTNCFSLKNCVQRAAWAVSDWVMTYKLLSPPP